MPKTAGPLPFPPPPPWAKGIFTVGITGTNGKTTTTAFVAAALSRLAGPALRITTVGCFLGDERLDVPATYDGFLAAMARARDARARFAAVELTSEALALGFAKAWPFSIGVFTNLTRDHLDAHGSPEHYLASKAQLFVHLPAGGKAILNAYDPASSLLAEVVPSSARISLYGAPSRAPGPPIGPVDVAAGEVRVGWEGTRVCVAPSARFERGPEEMLLRAIGDVYAENALAALAAAMAAGVAPAEAAAAISAAAPPPGRFQVLGRGPRAVVDYAHSPDALARTLAAARGLCGGRLTVVFGAGGDRDRGKRASMGESARGADRIVLTSDNPRGEDPLAIAEALRAGVGPHPDVRVILDRRDAILAALEGAGPDDVVVLAGRGPETEQIFADGKRSLSDVDVAAEALRRAGSSG
jgi:UDP-N-acetylmuramoyl-L-alanyl-D-glutamate--2,6-diaminopimelate ligase